MKKHQILQKLVLVADHRKKHLRYKPKFQDALSLIPPLTRSTNATCQIYGGFWDKNVDDKTFKIFNNM